MHYSPKFPTRPCWHCTAFGSMTAQGTAALCNRPGCYRVRAGPDTGCCEWEREVGTDDEPVHPDFRGSTPWSPAEGAVSDRPAPAQQMQWAPKVHSVAGLTVAVAGRWRSA